MKILGIIPARFASTRFPGKPMVQINGKTMIQRVYEQAKKAKSLTDVMVATDDKVIFEHVKSFGGRVVMTDSEHKSGTDRCAEIIEYDIINGWNVAVNIQGDEPFIQPEQIDLVTSCFSAGDVQIATLVKPITSLKELNNPNTPKVVVNKHKEAIYFSRAPIPYVRGIEMNQWLDHGIFYKHIGLYAYRAGILKKISQLEPSPLELMESLEQLRWIENGYKIKVEFTEQESISIDTPEDLEKALAMQFP